MSKIKIDKKTVKTVSISGLLFGLITLLLTYATLPDPLYAIAVSVGVGAILGVATEYARVHFLREVTFLDFKTLVSLTLYVFTVCGIIAALSIGIDRILQMLWVRI